MNSATRQSTIDAVGYALTAGCLALGIWLQQRVHLNHDVAWIVHGAGWMLDGKRFGTDIIDVNPPLMWFVSLPAAMLVKVGALGEPAAIRVWVWALCAASLWLANRMVEPLRCDGRSLESTALLFGAAFAMAVLPGAAFAQREHLAFVLGLPYGLLQASRLAQGAPSPRIAVVIGVFAGVAFGFKPWLLAVPLLLEAMTLWHGRRLRSCLRPETLALAVTLVVYALALLAFARAYLSEVVPMALATYWAYDGTGAPWFYWKASLMPLGGSVLLLALARKLHGYSIALLAMFLGYSLCYWAQGKGFAYHCYPALATAVTLFLLATACAAHAVSTHALSGRRWLKIVLLAMLPLLAMQWLFQWTKPTRAWLAEYDMAEGVIGIRRSVLIARINAALPGGGHVYAFSSHPFPAFPTMSYTRAEWSSAWVGQFTLPAWLARGQIKDPEKLAAIERAVKRQRADVLREMTEVQPEIVLIETKPDRLGMRGRRFNDIAFYSEDPRFAALWRHYREAPRVDHVRVFVREQPPAGGN